jgi:hypothetical protein
MNSQLLHNQKQKKYIQNNGDYAVNASEYFEISSPFIPNPHNKSFQFPDKMMLKSPNAERLSGFSQERKKINAESFMSTNLARTKFRISYGRHF